MCDSLSVTRNFQGPETFARCFQNNRPCFLILKERELLFTSTTQDMKFRLFNKKTLLVCLMIRFISIQMVVSCFLKLIKRLRYNCKAIHSGCKVLLPSGQKFSRNERSGCAGPKTANSVELIFVTGPLLRTSRNLFSRWTDCKGK